MSGYSPAWRRWLQQHARFLFRVCGEGNCHWRWDAICHCRGVHHPPVRLRGKKRP